MDIDGERTTELTDAQARLNEYFLRISNAETDFEQELDEFYRDFKNTPMTIAAKVTSMRVKAPDRDLWQDCRQSHLTVTDANVLLEEVRYEQGEPLLVFGKVNEARNWSLGQVTGYLLNLLDIKSAVALKE